ncbi:MAG: B12-binding domain-containing radical SAM protein [Deltaproteobacteria bacterium]|nr:B12-binding domain-containing radical SAM protein [Deltaproteobacteria bacterium]
MKILVLEHPRIVSEKRFNDIANTPLWSCLMGGYAAASLESEGFDTVFLDEALTSASFDETKKKIFALDPDLLCINTVYFWEHTQVLFEFIVRLKSLGFSGHINLFGFFPSLVYRQILKGCDSVDSIAVGEFEHTIADLATGLKKGLSLENIEGLALKSCLSDDKCRARKPEKNPDIFAFPKRNSLDGCVTILASRGCYNHCSFCPVPSFYNQGSLWRGRSPQNVAKEIEALVEKGAKDFYFCDPNFIGPGAKGKKRILVLMDLLKPMDIRFGMETRPQDLDDDLVEKLVDAGFKTLLMGIESGSGNVLNLINKSAGPALSAQAIALCRKHGIEPEIGFLMFVPDSSLLDLAENMKFLIKNNLLDRLDRTANLLSHTQIVLAGTSGYDWFEKENRLEKKGIFGFEADIVFSDPGVKWVATLQTFACHTILRYMGQRHSPIFWENEINSIHQKANAFIVDLCSRLISRAGKNQKTDNGSEIKEEKEKILARIHSIIGY